MHPDVEAVLGWSNATARNKRLKQLSKSDDIPPEDIVTAKRVALIRAKLFKRRRDLPGQDQLLKSLQSEFNTSRTQFKKLCQLACVCLTGDGTLISASESKPRTIASTKLKKVHHLKLCMFVS